MKELMNGVFFVLFLALIFIITGGIFPGAPDYVVLILFLPYMLVAGFLSFKVTNMIYAAPRIIQNTIEDIHEVSHVTALQKKNSDTYRHAKQSFRYLSDSTLIAMKLPEDQVSDKKFMEQLALEETLVERGIMNHSPIHEKMNALNRLMEEHKKNQRL